MKKVLATILCLGMMLSVFSMTALAAGYEDTDGHWAEESISRWSEVNIVEGIGDNLFDPNGSMTRAQAAAVFARLLKLSATADISNFADVPADAWYAQAIAMCVAAGIMNGISGDAMDPNGTLTREQMMTMLCRALGIEPEATCDKEFSDSDEVSDWAEGYVNALVNAGIVDGVGNNTMAPTTDINRASMMALLDKSIVVYADEEGAEVTVGEGTGIVLIVADNVTVKDAPEGTVVVTAPESTGATVNGTEVKEDSVIVVEKPSIPTTPSVPTPPADDDTTGDITSGDPTTGGSTTGGSTTGGSTTGGSTTGGSTTGGSTTGGSTTGGSTTGGTTTGGTTTD